MKRKKKLFSSNKSVSTEFNLNISPMAAVFVVTLVFLLKNSTMGGSSLSPTQNITLPGLEEVEALFEGPNIEVSESGVALDGEMILPLEKFNLNPMDLSTDGSITKLKEALQKKSGISLAKLAQPASDAKTTLSSKRVLVMADKKAPYSILKRVFSTTANEGYELLKLVVVHEGK